MAELTPYTPNHLSPSQPRENLVTPDAIGPTAPLAHDPAAWENDGSEVQRAHEDALAHAQQDRFIFTHEDERRRLEFEIKQAAPQPEVVSKGGETQVADDAYAAAHEQREAAAARQREQEATNAELRQAVEWNGQAVKATRDAYELAG